MGQTLVPALQRLARIPRELLHVGFEDLEGLGVPAGARAALRGLLADLPLAPDASFSSQLVGPPSVTLPALAVLARHVGQGLRDTNLSIAHDKQRLHTARLKLAFLSAPDLTALASQNDKRPQTESALFLHDLDTSREELPTSSSRGVGQTEVSREDLRQDISRRDVAPQEVHKDTSREEVLRTLATRHAAGLVSFVTSQRPVAELAHWRLVDLR